MHYDNQIVLDILRIMAISDSCYGDSIIAFRVICGRYGLNDDPVKLYDKFFEEDIMPL